MFTDCLSYELSLAQRKWCVPHDLMSNKILSSFANFLARSVCLLFYVEGTKYPPHSRKNMNFESASSIESRRSQLREARQHYLEKVSSKII